MQSRLLDPGSQIRDDKIRKNTGRTKRVIGKRYSTSVREVIEGYETGKGWLICEGCLTIVSARKSVRDD